MIPQITVVVCTHNRAHILKLCLDSLAKQKMNIKNYEVIIIDNKSTDQTSELAKIIIQDKLNYKYIYEPNLGLSHARNRGWQEARGVYVAYLDDDAIAYPDWLEQMYDFIKRTPEAAAFGGPYEGYALSKRPDWFPPEYGSHSLGEEDKIVEIPKEWISGGNIVFKKSVLDAHGGFSTDLGMKGRKVSYGEETLLTIEMAQEGHKIYYCPKMKIKHLIPEYKFSLWWLLISRYAVGRDSMAFPNKKLSFWLCFRSFILSGFKIFKVLVVAEKMPLQRRLYYSLRDVFYYIGTMSYFIFKPFVSNYRKTS